MGTLTDIRTIARSGGEKAPLTMMRRDMLPLAIVLFVLLVAVTGSSARAGCTCRTACTGRGR